MKSLQKYSFRLLVGVMAVSLKACLAASVTASPHLGDVWPFGCGWFGLNQEPWTLCLVCSCCYSSSGFEIGHLSDQTSTWESW